MKKAIYLLIFLSLLTSSCKVKKPILETSHIEGILSDTDKVNTDNDINLYEAKSCTVFKTKWKVKRKNHILRKKKYSQKVKDSLIKLHLQLREKALTSKYISIKTAAGKTIYVFVSDVDYDQINTFKMVHNAETVHLMFQGVALGEGQFKARELTSIYN